MSSRSPRVIGIAAGTTSSDAAAHLIEALPQELAFVIAGGLHGLAHAPLPVRAMAPEDATELHPGVVYLLPDGAEPAFDGDVLQTRAGLPGDAADALFGALARRDQELALVVVIHADEPGPLRGIEAIAQARGVSLALAGAVSGAIAAAVDHHLPHAALVHELARHVVGDRAQPSLSAGIAAAVPQICDALHVHTGHDVRHYKRSTLVRRAVRRAQALRTDAAGYIALLASSRAECARLFDDLLINVTAFFRDPDAFAALATAVIEPLLRRTPPRQLRIWVPGCATGEEAYSLAMLVIERAEALGVAHTLELQVFATDLDEHALQVARRGSYPTQIASQLAPARLERFFIRQDDRLEIAREVRERVLFSVHDVVGGPPFSRVDLISCRNVLIYLSSQMQDRLLSVFHYALNEGGFLFLGPSESAEPHRELFRAVVPAHRICQRSASAPRHGLVEVLASERLARTPPPARSPDGDLMLQMQRALLEGFAPRAAIVEETGRMLCASGDLDRYLTVGGGPFQNNITRLVRSELRVALRLALREAVELGRSVTTPEIALRSAGGARRVAITARPLAQPGDHRPRFLLVFSDLGAALEPEPGSERTPEVIAVDLIERLERDLQLTRRELDASVQELEAANEELKSSNEELLAMNEELQSYNEELKSSKEELQAANGALIAANDDLVNLMASTQIATIFLDEHGALRRFTPDTAAIYNVRPQDTGRPLAHYTHRAKAMPALPASDDPRLADRAIEDELELEDGRWLLRRVSAYRTADGTARGLVLTFLDITERRAAAQQTQRLARDLAHRVEELETLLRVLPIGIGIAHDAECQRITVNPAFAEMLGVAPTANASLSAPAPERPQSFRVFAGERELAPEDLPLQVAAREARMVRSFVARLVRDDGEVLHLLEYAAPLFGDDGRPRGSVGAFIDVTEQHATLARLEQRERELQSLAENIPDALIRYDRDLVHVFANRAAEQLLGTSAAALCGRPLAATPLPATVRDQLVRAAATVVQHRRSEAFTFEIARGDGEAGFHVTRLVPELDKHGALDSVLNVTHDVSAEHVASNALRDADRRKDEFLAMLAHELRNPLAPLRSGSELLRRLHVDDPRRTHVAEVMERQVAHVTRLVDDLLDVSRITRGTLELKRERLDLRAIIEAAIDGARPLILEARHELVAHLPDAPISVDGDPARLTQLLANLLTNAAKYTPPGGALRVEASASGDVAAVAITDNGYGIEPAYLGRIFEMFTQVPDLRAKAQGGLGIGLALVRRLAELHGGSVTATSAGPGTGSTFLVELPLAAPAPDAHPAPASRHTHAPRKTRRVLVVDDNQDAAELIAELLRVRGHEVRTAGSGADGFSIASTFRADVILLDIGLPDTSGYELAPRLRRLLGDAQPTLVALTGWGSPADVERAQRAGFDRHFTKPVTVDHLLGVVET